VQAFLDEEIDVLAETDLVGDDPGAWNLEGLSAALVAMGLTGDGTTADELWELGSRDAIANHIRDLADEKLEAKAAEVGEDDWKMVERLVLIRTIDSLWVEHLTELDDMRRGIGLRGYAQQDPLNEFKREAFQLYDELRGLIRHGVASSIFRVTVTRQPAQPAGGDPAVAASLARGAAALAGGNGSRGAASGGDGTGAGAGAPEREKVPAAAAATAASGSAILRGGPSAAPSQRVMRESLGGEPVASAGGSAAGGPKPGFTPSGARIGRNDPCWCGSGAKYKKCHGR
jgi:preprotein translocase subunit SecA